MSTPDLGDHLALTLDPAAVAAQSVMAGEVEGQPAPLAQGTFALYATPEGALVLVTDIPDRGVERNVLPAAMVKAAMTMIGGGGKLSAIGSLFKRKG